MTELGAILDAYLTLVGCHTVTTELLRKSSKGTTFHETVFQNQPLDETKRLLVQARRNWMTGLSLGWSRPLSVSCSNMSGHRFAGSHSAKGLRGFTRPSSRSRNLSRAARMRMWSVSVFIATGLPMESAGRIPYTQIL